MNLVAIDIGNTNITMGLFIKGEQKELKSISGNSKKELAEYIKKLWEQIPILKRAKEKKRDGVIVACSVKPDWTASIEDTAKNELDEKILIIGKDIPYPADLSIEQTYKDKIGSDRVITVAAAYSVVEDAVVVADFGTAVTIDLVDERGVFVGGVIFPGFEVCSQALKDATAQLPKVKITRPEKPYGTNTEEAINCGLYYSVIGALEEIVRRYAEIIGKWPQVIITGSGAKLIKDDCPFVDNYVPNLVIKGIALAYRNYLDTKI